jgi:hypothetical protein
MISGLAFTFAITLSNLTSGRPNSAIDANIPRRFAREEVVGLVRFIVRDAPDMHLYDAWATS